MEYGNSGYKILRSKRVWLANGFHSADIVIKDGKIAEVLPYKKADSFAGENEGSGVLYDYGEKRIVPGFIDVHTHGAYGFDTNDAKPEGLREWMRRIPEEGVTSILPTTVTQSPEILKAAAANVARVMAEGCEGAEIIGLHFEGPYFDMQYKGAQPPEAIAAASVEQFKEFQEAAKGNIRYISLAPEHDKDFELTKYCSSHGVVVSMGHSGADYETALMCIANGAVSMTHVYNGMSPYKHRSMGLVGAAFRVRDVYGEIICDCMHSDADALNVYFTTKGRDFGIMVSDSLRCKGAEKGTELTLGGHKVTVDENGLAHLEDGTIAGSTLKLNTGLKNLVERCGLPFDTAINSCTINPARCLKIDGRKGRIAYNYDADIVVLNDDYGVEETYCRGKAMLEKD